jgi:CRP-like cAMP-binding protein
MSLTELVKGHRFLSGLTDSQLGRLAELAREVTFRENELPLMASQQSRYFYLLLSGSVSIEVKARAFTVRVQDLGAGDAFGWSALLDEQDTLFQVRVREECRALCLNGSSLSALLQADPELAAELLRRALQLAAGRVRATEAMLAELCGVPMRKAKRAS